MPVRNNFTNAAREMSIISFAECFIKKCVFLLIIRYTSNNPTRLRHCTTRHNVASSIPDWVIGIFHCLYPSGRTVALGSTHPVTEMRNGYFLEVKAAGAYSWKRTTFMYRLSGNSGSLTFLEPPGSVQVSTRIVVPLLLPLPFTLYIRVYST